MRYPVRPVLHAEWTKLRTLPANAWLALATAGFTVAASVAVTWTVDTARCPSPTACFEDTTKLALGGVWLGQVAVVVLAVGMIGGEYGTGLIRATLAATPRRHTVLAAKAAVLAATVAAAGALGVLGALLAGRFILPRNGFNAANGYPPLSLADPATLRAAAGTVLYLVLVGLLALGLATLVRDTAAAVTTVLSLLYVAPALVGLVGDPLWHDRLERLAPMTAGLAIQATRNYEQLPIGPWPGLAVLTAWTTVALGAGGVLLARRDQ
ncbi:MAG TPA: ABC transporter permease subunit [Actinophytocola sp.]|nr:ABC transporter permease subunit [Actinophytocola sp.]